MIRKFFGHTEVQPTARYAHLANDSVNVSGSRVGDCCLASGFDADRHADVRCS